MEAFLCITTDATYYEENTESVEFWSPGSPLFKAPELLAETEVPPAGTTLRGLLNG